MYDIPGLGKSSEGQIIMTKPVIPGLVQKISGDTTETLPALKEGLFRVYKKTDSNATTVTIKDVAGNTVATLTELNETVRLYCNGSSWDLW